MLHTSALFDGLDEVENVHASDEEEERGGDGGTDDTAN